MDAEDPVWNERLGVAHLDVAVEPVGQFCLALDPDLSEDRSGGS